MLHNGKNRKFSAPASLLKDGGVYLIGAGPGDPSLITVKAAKALALADVVITDRLVSREIIDEYVSPSAIVVEAGKQGGSTASVPQYEINELLVQYAKEYKTVVRLKGGDTAIFSNILDELIALNNENIPYQIIPGITAASGASAYTGVPLTARGFSTGVRILTYYKNTVIASSEWKQMAGFNDTLLFYMSGKSLYEIVSNLLQAGADSSIPFIVVEQATTPNQQVYQCTLHDFYQDGFEREFASPSLVIIGKVAALYEQFAWLPNNNKQGNYFKPLERHPELIELINDFQKEANVSRA
ncbi:uroporphyrinogen-III C-methyltransferase [Foetidibacter luteolus]|uniref:uroporphyrinogen-III C-methyltransferase n=1 Tax=Foetidibacter luteolus TaxID=2608880 RepID=UPI001F1A1F43|nr:uroporphyrinogen-III C-methyltransferase [Foetidibacter luteolus]